jgi:hypothetical protein
MGDFAWSPATFESLNPSLEFDGGVSGSPLFLAEAAIEGGIGMQVIANGANSQFGRMDTPGWTDRLRVGFRLHDHGATKAGGSNSKFVLMHGGSSHWILEFRVDPTPRLRLGTRQVGGSTATTAYYLLEDSGAAPWTIEVELYKNVSGYSRLHVNGVQVIDQAMDTTNVNVADCEFGKRSNDDYQFDVDEFIALDDIRGNDTGADLGYAGGIEQFFDGIVTSLGAATAQHVADYVYTATPTATGAASGASQVTSLQPLLVITNEGITLPPPEAPPEGPVGGIVKPYAGTATETSAATGVLDVDVSDPLAEWAKPWEGTPASTDVVEGTVPSWGDHPYLAFDATELLTLRTESRQVGHKRKEIYDALKSGADSWLPSTPTRTNAILIAFIYAIEKDNPATAAPYGDAIIAFLNNSINTTFWEHSGGENPVRVVDRKYGEHLYNYAMAFDMAHDHLVGEANYQAWLDRLGDECQIYRDVMETVNLYGNSWSHQYSQNHYHRSLLAYTAGVSAALIHGADFTSHNQADVDGWLARLKSEIHKNHAAHKDNLGGNWNEGGHYMQTSLHEMAQALWVAKHALNYDALTTSPLMRMAPIANIYMGMPTGRFRNMWFAWGDISVAWARRNGLLELSRAAARYHSDGYAQWKADEDIATSGTGTGVYNGREVRDNMQSMVADETIVFELLAHDDTVAPTSPQGVFPPWYHDEDMGLAMFIGGFQAAETGFRLGMLCGQNGGKSLFNAGKRSHVWDSTHSGGQGEWRPVFEFDAGANPIDPDAATYPQDMVDGFSHSHADAGCIMLFGNGKHYIPEVSGNKDTNAGPWGRRPTSQNTIQVDGLGMNGGNLLGGRPFAEVGGRSWMQEREDFYTAEPIEIDIFAPSVDVSFARGEYTKAWGRRSQNADNDCPRLNMTDARRHVFFLRRAPVGVLVVDTLDSTDTHTYTWNLSSLDQPSKDGMWVRSYAGGTDMAAVKVLSPSSFGISSRRHPEDANEQTQNSIDFYDSDDELWSWSYDGPAGVSKFEFINYITPTNDAGWNTKPDPVLVAHTATHCVVRVDHDDGAEDWILCGFGETGEWTGGGFTVDGSAAVLRKDSGGNVTDVFVADGTKVQEGATVHLQTIAKVDSLGVYINGAALVCSGVNVQQFTVKATGITSATVNNSAASFNESGGFVTVG